MQCYESINLQLEIAYVKLTILFFLMNLRKSKYFIWTIILFVSTSLPSIVEVFSSWNSQLTFKQEETQILKHFIKYEVVFSFWATIIMLPILIKNVRKYYLLFLGLTIFPINLFYFIHVILFGASPNSATLFSIFSTNRKESWEFSSDYISFSIIIIILLYPVVFYLVYKLLSRLSFFRSFHIALVTIMIIFTSFGFLKFTKRLGPISFKNIPIVEIGKSYQTFREEQRLIDQMMASNYKFKTIVNDQPKEPETHVIIIGESTSRHHMGIYGYWRNTTPLLTEHKDEFIFFDSVTTPNAHTVPALTKAFSIEKTPATLMDLLSQAKVETHWISNQAVVGENETPIYLFASRTDTKTFVNSGGYGKQFDINVLPELQKIVKESSGKRVVFIHLLGTHLSYKERYPENFNTFKNFPKKQKKDLNSIQQNFINQYDNANKYNDFIISSIVKEIQKLDHRATVTYFSDHGDEVYDMRNFHGHSDVLQSHYMTDVPFVFWSNSKYKENNLDLIKRLKTAKSKSFSLQNFSHFAQDIIGVKCEDYIENKSIASSVYLNKPKKQLETVIAKTTNDIPNFGIWVHRVNGIDRLNEVKNMFSGFEIDLVYNLQNNYFDVNHPPAESIKLSLSSLINNLENPAEKHYWLDLKNINKQNCESALKRLVELSNLHDIRKNFILESKCLDCLQRFSEEGFFTSKYLPFYHQMAESEMNYLIFTLSDSLNHLSVSAISQERGALSILNSKFNTCDKLVWDLSLDWKEESSRKEAKEILKDNPSIKVLLVRYETPSYR